MKRLNYCIYFVFALLGAHFAYATWECNGKAVVSDASVTLPDSFLFPPIGCIYKGYDVSVGDHYFEMKVGNIANHVKVGVASEFFSKQYFYDNDLSNGCVTPLKPYFGDKVNSQLYNPQASDTVGVVVKNINKEIYIYLLHDGVPLGLAFKIINPSTPLFPAILVTGHATVTFTRKTFAEIPPDNMQRSAKMFNNYYKVTTLNGFEKKPDCVNQQIRLRPYFPQQLKKDINDDNHDIDVYVSVIIGTDEDKIDGLLSRRNKQWTFDDIPENECLKAVKSVLKTIASIKLNDRILTITSKDKKSIEAQQWTFPTATCY